MKKSLFLIFSLFLIILLISSCSTSTSTEKYPNKAIQLIVAYTPGAATDTQARIIAKYAKKYIGQELVIVNKPGGGGQVGWNYFSSVEPDAYILAVYNLPHIITQPLVGRTSFSLDTFDPIVNWGKDPTVFAVKKNSDIKSLQNLLEQAKSKPGEITIGTPGKFVGQHLAILIVEKSQNIDVQDIPYKGSSEAIASLLGGHIEVIAGNLSDMYRLGDEVRILAIATNERHPLIPDVPTFKELGLPDVIMSTDRGIAAKKGTPIEIVKQLEQGFLNLMKDEEFLKDMEKAGADMQILNREEVAKDFKERFVLYEELLKSIPIN